LTEIFKSKIIIKKIMNIKRGKVEVSGIKEKELQMDEEEDFLDEMGLDEED
jgi:hypothetical protein